MVTPLFRLVEFRLVVDRSSPVLGVVSQDSAWFGDSGGWLNQRSVHLSGVSLAVIDCATYGISGVFAALAALYLTTQTGTGSPTIGKDYILPSVAAAVIGGVSLFGGRGEITGAIAGAFILTILGNLVFALSISSYWQTIISGVILLAAVVISAMVEKSTNGNLVG